MTTVLTTLVVASRLIKSDKMGVKGQSLNLDTFLCDGEVVNPSTSIPSCFRGKSSIRQPRSLLAHGQGVNPSISTYPWEMRHVD